MWKKRSLFIVVALGVVCSAALALLPVVRQQHARATGGLEPAIVFKLSWGPAVHEVGFRQWPEGVQGPDTFTVDQQYFYIADGVNRAIKIFDRSTGMLVQKIDYPELLKIRYPRVQQMLAVDKTIFLVCKGMLSGPQGESLYDFDANRWKIGNDWGPPGPAGDGWSVIIYQNGEFKELDLASEIPNFAGPFRLEQLPCGVMVRRDAPPEGWGNGLDQAPFAAVVDAEGKLLGVKSERYAGIYKDTPFYEIDTREGPWQVKLKAYDFTGKELKAVPIFEREGVNVFYRGSDQKGNIYVGVKPASLMGTSDFYVVVFSRDLAKKSEYRVTLEKERPKEYPPNLSTGEMFQVSPDGKCFNMAFRKDGFAIYQLLPVGETG
ncbi:MAG: hypothetical protein QHH75_12480 [Bacillota bacterium]|nr:hypothetical protein [Bacillota bacterium]